MGCVQSQTSTWIECPSCIGSGAPAWLQCLDTQELHAATHTDKASAGVRRRARDQRQSAWYNREDVLRRLEELTRELFDLHDLDGNDLLEEHELVALNAKIAVLHHGESADVEEVRRRYTDLFRAKLDPHGRPAPYDTFRAYAFEVLEGLDSDLEAQEMILEQFIAEARAGRLAMLADKMVCPPVEVGWATFPLEKDAPCGASARSSPCKTPSTSAGSPVRSWDAVDTPSTAAGSPVLSTFGAPTFDLSEVLEQRQAEWGCKGKGTSQPYV